MSIKERIEGTMRVLNRQSLPPSVGKALHAAYDRLLSIMPSEDRGFPSLWEARDAFMDAVHLHMAHMVATRVEGQWDKAYERLLKDTIDAWGPTPPTPKVAPPRPELDAARTPIGPTVPSEEKTSGAASAPRPPLITHAELQQAGYKAVLTDAEYTEFREFFDKLREKETALERTFSPEEYTALLHWMLSKSQLPSTRPRGRGESVSKAKERGKKR